MFKSAFPPETIFRRSFCLKWTDRTCWTIQTHSDEFNWARRKTFHEFNSLSLVRFMKGSTFGLGLRATTMATAKPKLKPFKITTLHVNDSLSHVSYRPQRYFPMRSFLYELTTSNFPFFFCMWMWFLKILPLLEKLLMGLKRPRLGCRYTTYGSTRPESLKKTCGVGASYLRNYDGVFSKLDVNITC